MSSFKQQNSGEGGPPARGRGFDLWYYQDRGDGRTYFRLAPFGLALLIIPVILSLLAITALFVYRKRTPVKTPDITITPPPAPADPATNSGLKPVAPPPTPPPVRTGKQVQSPILPQATPSAGKVNTAQPTPLASPIATP